MVLLLAALGGMATWSSDLMVLLVEWIILVLKVFFSEFVERSLFSGASMAMDSAARTRSFWS